MSFEKTLRQKPVPEILALVAFATLAIGVLVHRPIVGLADTGDYYRVMSRAGLEYLTEDFSERYFWHLNERYGFTAPRDEPYFSSELSLTQIAILFDNLMTRDDLFSIQAMGWVHTAGFLAALGLILFALRRHGLAVRFLAGFLFVFIYADVGNLAWFNSLYSEPASIIFLFSSLGLALHLADSNGLSRQRLVLSILFWLSVFLFLAAKPQNAPCTIVLLPLGYCLTLSPLRRRRWELLLLGLIPVLMLLLFSGWYALKGQPAYMKPANLYNVVFADLLKYSPAPEADMRELGIYDPSFLDLIGEDIFVNQNPLKDSDHFREVFHGNIGYGKILSFYLRHPCRAWNLIDRTAEKAYDMRPQAMGNFTRLEAPVVTDDEGRTVKPGVPLKSQAFSCWSRFKKTIFPGSGLFLVGFFLAGMAAIAIKAWIFDRTSADLCRTAVHGAVPLLALLQYATAIVGEGEVAIVKHLYLFNVLFDGLLIVLVLYAVGGLAAGLGGTKPRNAS